ncbi:nebulin-like [Chiloscyllium plagiosum]|uniref:nebulin-like n=1 Tax=Chiloscyllium plagiosum TaxID=36176 RepID=UPI001CB7CEE6|nr:nebulin-like [Chiloscyllium plagiosum]
MHLTCPTSEHESILETDIFPCSVSCLAEGTVCLVGDAGFCCLFHWLTYFKKVGIILFAKYFPISKVKYHEDFEKTKGSFTSVVTDPITERVKKNMQDFSDISYRGIQRRVVEMQRRRVENEAESLTDLRVWRTNPGSVFDYDPAEDNIQSRSLHMLSIQAQRRSREHSRSASALSLSGGDEKSEPSEPDQTITYYNGNNFFQTTATSYQHTKTTVLPQQRSSSVATQQTTVSSIPSHPSTTGKTYRAIYDYSAADADEVSFKDGDVLMNVQSIDEGWMYGTVQRTGMTGMLPANYVDAI